MGVPGELGRRVPLVALGLLVEVAQPLLHRAVVPGVVGVEGGEDGLELLVERRRAGSWTSAFLLLGGRRVENESNSNGFRGQSESDVRIFAVPGRRELPSGADVRRGRSADAFLEFAAPRGRERRYGENLTRAVEVVLLEEEQAHRLGRPSRRPGPSRSGSKRSPARQRAFLEHAQIEARAQALQEHADEAGIAHADTELEARNPGLR